MATDRVFSAEDFGNGTKGRWCAGCGDFGLHAALKKALAEIGTAPEHTEIISGIGCSSRIVYYMNGYCFHTIHGRAIAVASGAKIAKPENDVWVATGDGDCLAIGGNHFIHALRRNIDLNIILLNNRIYGLTKGQYSPTSKRGFVSKSSPYGTVEDPFQPGILTLGAGGTFFARTIGSSMAETTEILKAAHRHKGASVVETLVNCVTFNDGTFEAIYSKENQARNTIMLRHGEKMVFGENNEKGIVRDGLGLKVVTIGKDGYTLDDVLTHDAHTANSDIQRKLAGMKLPDFPVALGVIRDVEAPTYDEAVSTQVEEVKKMKPYHCFAELLKTNNTWEIK